MGEHRDGCRYWEEDRSPMFQSSGGSERVSLDLDAHCKLIIVSGFYESLEVPFDEFFAKFGFRRWTVKEL